MPHTSPKNNFIPLSRPSFGEEEKKAVLNCLESGWVTTGPQTAKFEEKLCVYFGGRHTLALSSNTAGLYLALKALGIGPGDEVITSPLTFAATANVIEWSGAQTVFCDVDPRTRNLDPGLVQKAITHRTKAIIPIHFAGLAADMAHFFALAKQHNLRIIEDAAHAFGATYADKKIGTFGDIQVFSFHANKNLSSCEGGAIVTDDKALLEKIRSLSFHGLSTSAWERAQGKKNVYDITQPGLKFNMMDLQATLGLCQLKKIDHMNHMRKHLVSRYVKALTDSPYLEMPPTSEGRSWNFFAPLVRTDRLGINRDALATKLKEKGVGTTVHYRPLHLFSYYRKAYPALKEGTFPHAENIGSTTLSLPLWPHLAEQEQDIVIEKLIKTLEENAL